MYGRTRKWTISKSWCLCLVMDFCIIGEIMPWHSWCILSFRVVPSSKDISHPMLKYLETHLDIDHLSTLVTAQSSIISFHGPLLCCIHVLFQVQNLDETGCPRSKPQPSCSSMWSYLQSPAIFIELCQGAKPSVLCPWNPQALPCLNLTMSSGSSLYCAGIFLSVDLGFTE